MSTGMDLVARAKNERTTAPPDDGVDGVDDEKPPKKSVATLLVELAEEHYTLGVGTDGLAFGIERGGANIAHPLRGGRLGLRAALADMYMTTSGRAASSSALADAMLVIEGRCQHEDPVQLYHRVAPFEDGIVIDLGTPDGRVVIIDPTGWKISERSPVTFRRSELTLPLPEPERAGVDLMAEPLGNITAESWPLVVGWLVAALIEHVPHPVLFLRGEHGTGKTTMARNLGALIDPTAAPVRSSPRDQEQWAVTAAGSWLVALDNLSGMTPWFSDALCRAVTGEGLVRRKLYSDDDVTVLSFRRVIILTAIDAGSLRGDLADRLLSVDLETIPKDRRRTDLDLARQQQRQHAGLLGALYDLTADVLAALPSVHLAELPRMADFAQVLAAVDQVRPCDGQGALALYLRLGEDLAKEVVEGDPLAAAVAHLARARFTWTGTATELAVALAVPDPKPKDWPGTARAISGALSRVAPALRLVGIDVDRGRSHGSNSKRQITLRADKAADQ